MVTKWDRQAYWADGGIFEPSGSLLPDRGQGEKRAAQTPPRGPAGNQRACAFKHPQTPGRRGWSPEALGTHENLIRASKSAPVRTVLNDEKFSAAFLKALLWSDQLVSKAPRSALEVIKDRCAARALPIPPGAHLRSQGYN